MVPTSTIARNKAMQLSVFHSDAVRSYISTHGLLPAKRFVQQGCRKAKYLPQTVFSSCPYPVFHFNGLVLAGFYSTNKESNDVICGGSQTVEKESFRILQNY